MHTFKSEQENIDMISYGLMGNFDSAINLLTL